MKEQWPDNIPAIFENLVDPIVDAICFAYKIERQNKDEDIPYKGLPYESAGIFSIDQVLSKEHLDISLNDQGRTALVEIVSCAVRLGMEQGQRVLKNDLGYKLDKEFAKEYKNLLNLEDYNETQES